ncbi:MAG: zinc ribbon domain-containing protein [Pseudomonadota bacterium]
MNDAEFGILSCGSYVPRGRLSATTIGAANGWFSPALAKAPVRRRSFCNWDEDALTMAVEAGRDCLKSLDEAAPGSIELASTTLPFADRSNAGVLREALDLPANASIRESGGSLRAAATMLARALAASGAEPQLLIASDCIDTRPAAAGEASAGHGAAAVTVGHGRPLATLLGTATLNQDFVDHYRASGERFDYSLEARWARDAGYRDQTRETYAAALESAGLDADGIDRIALAAPPLLHAPLARQLAADGTAEAALYRGIGFCGAAQPLLALAAVLAASDPGDRIALCCIGQGVEVLIFDVRRRAGGGAPETAGVDEPNYCRYLALRRLLQLDEGIRAERDNRTSQSAAWRKHGELTGFKGGKCAECGTLQFPQSLVCVNCRARDSQVPERMADLGGRVRSFTEDWLAFTPRPPLMFGNIGFRDGANVMMEFTDTDAGELTVGMPVTLHFRIKDFDERRGFRRYFWKPVPAREAAHG